MIPGDSDSRKVIVMEGGTKARITVGILMEVAKYYSRVFD